MSTSKEAYKSRHVVIDILLKKVC